MKGKSIKKRDCKHTDDAIISPRAYKLARTYSLARLFDTIEVYSSPSTIAHAIWNALEFEDSTRDNPRVCIDGDFYDLLCELADAFADMDVHYDYEFDDDDE